MSPYPRPSSPIILLEHPNALDVAVVGAGLAGLVCAQQLQRAGLRVLIVEKSRGVGGRLATRRLQDSCADHGMRYLTHQGPLTNQLIPILLQQGLIQPWIQLPTDLTDRADLANQSAFQPSYSAATGLTAMAKWLATGLEIHLGQRVEKLSLVQTDQSSIWQLALLPSQAEPDPTPIWAKAVVLAVPAPQAQTLVEPLTADGLEPDFVAAIQTVEFAPCITAIARYDFAVLDLLAGLPPGLAAATADVAWLSQEQTKERAPVALLVVQSTADFARRHLETADLAALGHLLLEQIATLRPELAPLKQPVELQMHRWRYGLVEQPLTDRCLSTATPAPLACSGDWCGGRQAEAALTSGLATAAAIMPLLEINRFEPNQLDLTGQFSALLHQIQQNLNPSSV